MGTKVGGVLVCVTDAPLFLTMFANQPEDSVAFVVGLRQT